MLAFVESQCLSPLRPFADQSSFLEITVFKSLGLAVPTSILIRADKAIE